MIGKEISLHKLFLVLLAALFFGWFVDYSSLSFQEQISMWLSVKYYKYIMMIVSMAAIYFA
ncbi:hypothetical protein, partial [Shewanella sp. MBTL60-007]|uniref:hypothetical protein n=1 Tax=Shewanella sp. MBTL60-007 TaxID=2815911 RepID=UPI001C806B00